jgi:hypothetical protein
MAQDNSGIMGLQDDYFSKGMLPPEMGIEVADGVMQNLDPQLRPAVDGISSEISGELADISDEELDQVIQLVQQLYDDPDNYPANRAALIQSGELTEEDLPPEYDPEALATMLYMLRKEKQARSGGMSMQPPSSMPPMAGTAPEMMQPPQGFARGGIAEAARIVANSGRYGDTMLAHINPREAQLLRKHGGSGTINPKTGLPEFIFKFLRKVWQAVWKPVKKFLKSDIGKIVSRIALNVVLPGYGEVIYAGLQTAANDGSFGDIVKNMAIAGATQYLGGQIPGVKSPLQGFSDKIAGNLGIQSALGKEAFLQGAVNTGAGLLQGQDLKTAATSGLVSAGSVVASSYLKDVKAAREGAPAPGTAPIEDIDTQTGVRTPDRTSAYSANNTGVPAYASSSGTTFDVDANAPNVSSNVGVRSTSSTLGQAQANAGTSTNMQTGANAGTSTAAPYKPVEIGDAVSTMGRGTKQMLTGDVSGGFNKLTEGAGDLFFPSSPSTKDIVNSEDYQSLIAQKISPDEAYKIAAKKLEPGFMRTYGPGAAAGLGIMAMAGGFDAPGADGNPGPPQLPGPTGSDLLKQNPNKYLVQGLPGVNYDAQGNIIGNKEQYPYYKLPDIQVASNYGGQRQFADGGIVHLASGGPLRLSPNYRKPIQKQEEKTAKAPIRIPVGGGVANLSLSSSPAGMTPEEFKKQEEERKKRAGIAALATGGYPRKTGQISGPGTETSDSIPAMLSDGEFVMTARAVRGLGKGSRREGAKKMYALMHQLERNAARG